MLEMGKKIWISLLTSDVRCRCPLNVCCVQPHSKHFHDSARLAVCFGLLLIGVFFSNKTWKHKACHHYHLGILGWILSHMQKRASPRLWSIWIRKSQCSSMGKFRRRSSECNFELFELFSRPSSIRQKNYGVHPLEKSEKSYYDREQFTRASVLRSVQGIHAPLRLLAERRAAGKVGHLPCLPRSNLMADVLDGRDELLLPEDIFNSKSLKAYLLVFNPFFRSKRVLRSKSTPTPGNGTSTGNPLNKYFLIIFIGH